MRHLSGLPGRLASELSGEIGLTRSSINLRKLHLEQPSLKGDVTGEGEVIFPEGSPFLRIRTKLAHLDLDRILWRKNRHQRAI